MSFADDIPAEFLWCKDMRHAWDPDSLVSRQVFNRRIERWEVHRTVRCLNCGGHKTQKLTNAFQVLSTDYDYAAGYSVTGHRGYVVTTEDRAQIRALSTALRGGTEKASADDRAAARKKTPSKKTPSKKTPRKAS